MQKYTSANTSINSTKLPMIYNHKATKDIISNKRVIDIGGGKFDNAIEYCKTLNADLKVYDKYNRAESHNAKVLVDNYDVAIISNVLNVIDDKEARAEVVRLATNKADTVLITVYEGDKSGIGKVSKKDCWQENRPTKDYIKELSEITDYHIETKGKLIIMKR